MDDMKEYKVSLKQYTGQFNRYDTIYVWFIPTLLPFLSNSREEPYRTIGCTVHAR